MTERKGQRGSHKASVSYPSHHCLLMIVGIQQCFRICISSSSVHPFPLSSHHIPCTIPVCPNSVRHREMSLCLTVTQPGSPSSSQAPPLPRSSGRFRRRQRHAPHRRYVHTDTVQCAARLLSVVFPFSSISPICPHVISSPSPRHL